jgi:hypothetical protein
MCRIDISTRRPPDEELNRSLGVDRRLWSEDIEASRAWVCALERAGVLERDEAATIDAGLLDRYERFRLYHEAEEYSLTRHESGLNPTRHILTHIHICLLRAGARCYRYEKTNHWSLQPGNPDPG